jgi:hypothetical protein
MAKYLSTDIATKLKTDVTALVHATAPPGYQLAQDYPNLAVRVGVEGTDNELYGNKYRYHHVCNSKVYE